MRERAQAMMADKDAQIAAVKVLQPGTLPTSQTGILPAVCQLPKAGSTCSANTHQSCALQACASSALVLS